MSREYPSHPRLGVGAVILDGGRVLLVKRGGQPSAGKWSLPGGLVDLGETTVEAIVREVAEECGLQITIAGLAGIVDRVVRDDAGRVRYHYVLVDYLAYPVHPGAGTPAAGSDAADVAWVEVDTVERLDITEGLVDMIRRAQALATGDAS